MAGRRPTAPSAEVRYWLFKSEPEVFSIHDLAKVPRKTTHWEGVRNYQARNLLRDEITPGDGVLFYNSRAVPLAIVGTMRVARAAYPDASAFDPNSRYYDPRSKPETPAWVMVDVRLTQIFPEPVPRDRLRETPDTQSMMVLHRGMRLSIQPVTPAEWLAVHQLAGVKPL